MAHEEQRPFELIVEVREGLVELRTRVGHMEAEVGELRKDVRSELGELRHDIRRLDARVFQLLLAQLATLATAMGALVATLAA
jgi:hypothetical protein